MTEKSPKATRSSYRESFVAFRMRLRQRDDSSLAEFDRYHALYFGREIENPDIDKETAKQYGFEIVFIHHPWLRPNDFEWMIISNRYDLSERMEGPKIFYESEYVRQGVDGKFVSKKASSEDAEMIRDAPDGKMISVPNPSKWNKTAASSVNENPTEECDDGESIQSPFVSERSTAKELKDLDRRCRNAPVDLTRDIEWAYANMMRQPGTVRPLDCPSPGAWVQFKIAMKMKPELYTSEVVNKILLREQAKKNKRTGDNDSETQFERLDTLCKILDTIPRELPQFEIGAFPNDEREQNRS